MGGDGGVLCLADLRQDVGIAADVAVEVISKSNPKAEIARKMTEYLAAGTRLMWVVDPKTRTAR